MAALVEGRLAQFAAPPKFDELVARHRGDVTLRESIAWLGELLYGGLSSEVTGEIEHAADRGGQSAGGPLAAAVEILLLRPEAHLA